MRNVSIVALLSLRHDVADAVDKVKRDKRKPEIFGLPQLRQ
jgi:hypothetical protein